MFQISKEAIRTFAKEGKVPKITSDLLYCIRHGHSRKMKWKQSKHHLKGVGIYSIEESKKGVKHELSASLDHRLYTPIITSIKDTEIPNKYCFVMKVCLVVVTLCAVNNCCFNFFCCLHNYIASFVVERERSKVLLCW